MAKLTLQHLKGNTYYIPSPTNVGVYVDAEAVTLIDSGNDKEAGRQILRLLDEQGWRLQRIINTHSNADHIGGNAYLQQKTGCEILATRLEAALINDPILEPALLFGGFPHKELMNKFLVAKPSTVTNVITSSGEILDTGLRAIPLPGHFLDMIGIFTPDNILFIADSLFPEQVINKYHLFFLWDIEAQFETLDKLAAIEADMFIPSHGVPSTDLQSLVRVNKAKIKEIADKIADLCIEEVTTEEVLQKVCEVYNISLNATQFVLVTSTLRSFLAYLYHNSLVDCNFENGRMTWKTKKEIS